jgi:hypothetical protein
MAMAALTALRHQTFHHILNQTLRQTLLRQANNKGLIYRKTESVGRGAAVEVVKEG